MLPSSRAPIVNQLVVYKVGSADEVYGKTGIAHFLEHMMFKGTGTVGADRVLAHRLARTAGATTPITSFDTTGYYQTVAPDRLEMVMRMEADRMANLRITEKELIPERQVVLEERRMRIDNSPAALLGEAVQEQLFGRHKPYGMPISGYVDDVKKLNVHDLAAFYAKWYMPNNAILIVAGDTTADAGAQARREALRADRRAQGRAAAPAGARAPPTCRSGSCAPTRASPSRAGRATTSRRPTTRARASTPMPCRCWRACWAAARPAACGGPWWSTARSRCRRAAAYSPSSLGLTSFDLGVHPASGTPMVEVESAVGELMRQAARRRRHAPRRSSGRRTSSWPRAIYSQDSLQSGPRIYGGALGIGGTHGRHRRLAAAHRRRHAGRRGRRRAPRLARRRAR